MPVEFLTDEQARRNGRFVEVPSLDQLDRYVFLDNADVGPIGRRRMSTISQFRKGVDHVIPHAVLGVMV